MEVRPTENLLPGYVNLFRYCELWNLRLVSAVERMEGAGVPLVKFAPVEIYVKVDDVIDAAAEGRFKKKAKKSES